MHEQSNQTTRWGPVTSQHVWYQVAIRLSVRVAPHGDLVIGGTIYIIEHWPRQTLLGQATEVIDVAAVREMHEQA